MRAGLRKRVDARGHFLATAFWLIVITLMAACATPSSQSAPKPVVVAPELSLSFRSWSWSILSGAPGFEPLIVGLGRNIGQPTKLVIAQFHENGHLEQLTNIPAVDGALYSATAVRHASGASIVATVIDASGVPQITLLHTRDGRSWRRVELSEDLRFVPTAVLGEADGVLLGRDTQLWRIGPDGKVGAVPAPSGPPSSTIALLARGGTRLWLLMRGEGRSLDLHSSEDHGATWSPPHRVEVGSEEIDPAGMIDDDGRLFLAGQCAPDGAGRPCVVVGSPEEGWRTENPFGTTTIPLRLLPPAKTADRNLRFVATISGYAEAWLAERSFSGQWHASRASALGRGLGEARAVGAGPSGMGFLVVVNDFESTRLVYRRSTVPAQGGDQSFVLGGPQQAPWIETTGAFWGEHSQLQLSHREHQPVGTGGAYRGVKKSIPISVADGAAKAGEWRPAAARGMDAILAEQIGPRAVLAGSTPVLGDDLGQVHVFTAADDGSWAETATEFSARLKDQLPTALVAGDQGWTLATAYPIRALSSEPARLFHSEDGLHWREEPGPTASTGEPSAIDALCPSRAGELLALGGLGARTEAAWVRRSDGNWTPLPVPPDPRGCAALEDTVVTIASQTLWSWDGQTFGPLETDLPEKMEPYAVVPVPGGLALVGVDSRDGVDTSAVWFSRDAREWQETRWAHFLAPVISLC